MQAFTVKCWIVRGLSVNPITAFSEVSMRARLLMIVAVGLLLAADEGDDAIKAEVKKFQGNWEAQSIHEGDAKAAEEKLKGLRLVIDGDKWASYQGDRKGREHTWKVDPSKDPRHLDLTAMINGKEVVFRCLY